jgi:TolB-like protein
LGRDVALKILPEAFARDPGRLARFEREARVLATLSHPGIAAIYGLEPGENGPALVMELVEGEGLEKRLARGRIPVRQALELARQMAAALESAHAKGIIHRDLKPSNVRLTPEGQVKLLDFGLAKALATGDDREGETQTEDGSTATGVVMGTAPYMSPEQARGEALDRRTDVWSFGCGLYEMLAGARAFPGHPAEAVAAVLEREPEWGALPAETPAKVVSLLRRCLQKDRNRRLHDIADARIELEEALAGVGPMAAPAGFVPRALWRGRRSARVAAGLLLMVGLTALGFYTSWHDRLLRRTAPAPRIESIAVLPLENLSHDPAQEYFADGMTEELTTNLGKISALRVISRTSVLRFKGTKQPLSEIAKELNVDALVEGTVLLSGNRVRITASLLHAPADRHLWAETYERDLQDVLSLQAQVAESVARAIKVTLSPAESRRLATVRSVKPEAYGLYLKGRYHYYKWRPNDFRQAIEYFQKAIDADPDWAPPYAGLATSYGWLWISGGVSAQEALPRFQAALKTALAIDETDPQARYALATSAFFYRWDWEEADREFQRALALDPGLVEARFEYAWFLSLMGRFPAAVAEAQRAVERDPLSVSANFALGDIYFLAREDDRATAQFRRTIDLDPNDPRPYEALAGMYDRMGKHQEAVTTRQKAMTLSGVRPDEVVAFARAYSQSGYEGCLRWRLERTSAPYSIARIHAKLGQKDEALVWLEKAYKEHSWAMCQLKVLPDWDPLRSDPRFQDLLRRMKFPP